MNIISLFVDAANRDAGSGECRVREYDGFVVEGCGIGN